MEDTKTNKEIVSFETKDGKMINIEKRYAELSNFLKTLISTQVGKKTNDKGMIVLDYDEKDLKPIFQYLATGNPKDMDIELYKYFDIGTISQEYHSEFLMIYLREQWYRKNTIQNPQVIKIPLNQAMKEFSTIIPPYDEKSILYSPYRMMYISSELKESVKLEKNISLNIKGVNLTDYRGKLVLAGGSLVSLLLQQPIKDYDFFFVNCSFEEASTIIHDIVSKVSSASACKYVNFHATSKCWTIQTNDLCFQFIFRNYKNIEEILLGFDIDASCIVHDGNDIYLSERCVHAFKYHVNVVDFQRMSPTYEYRLYKYWLKGFDVFIPGFNEQSVTIPNSGSLPNLDKLHLSIDQQTGVMEAYQIDPPVWRRRSRRRRKTASYSNNDQVLPNFFRDFFDPNYSRKEATPIEKKPISQTKDSKSEITTKPNNLIQAADISDEDSNDTDEGRDSGLGFKIYRKRKFTFDGPDDNDQTDNSSTQTPALLTNEHFVTKNTKKLRIPIFGISGIDILLFLVFVIRGRQVKITASDYNQPNSDSKNFISFFTNYGDNRILTVPNNFVKITGRLQRCLNIYKIFLQLIRVKNIEPDWIIENPGNQITSSFHSKVITNPFEWFKGRFYNSKLTETKSKDSSSFTLYL